MNQSKIARLESGKVQFTQKIIFSLANSFELDPLEFIFLLMGETSKDKDMLVEEIIVRQFTQIYNYFQEIRLLYDDLMQNGELIQNNIERDRAYYVKEWILMSQKCYEQEKEIKYLKDRLHLN